MAFLEIENLHKSFGANTALHHFDMKIERGEFITFLGPSGCGKTTVLRMIAGFETPTRGTIRLDGREVTHLRTRQRKVGMVFQSYALFPNMTVADNIGFGLKITHRPQEEIKKRVEEMLQLIKLPHLGERYPWQLSGGQQQRVALARALAGKPQVLLLDEPSLGLAPKLVAEIFRIIRSINADGVTVLLVEQNAYQALSIAHYSYVLRVGRVVLEGTAEEMKDRNDVVRSYLGRQTAD